MTTEQAVFLRDFLLKSIEAEYPVTRQVIAAVPNDMREYRPDPKSMSAGELAWHIVEAEIVLLRSIVKGEFGSDQPEMNANKTIDETLAIYAAEFRNLIDAVRKLSPDQLTKTISFFGVFNYEAVEYLNFVLTHTVHHRGQLSKYLRPMGSKVPPIYGPSADKMWEPPAAEAASS